MSSKYKFIRVYGANGMLGRYVCSWLRSKGHIVDEIVRDRWFDISWTTDKQILQQTNGADYVVNCAGIIKQRKGVNIEEMIAVNSVFPHQLARICGDKGIPLIHITTDCVFSGERGCYTELDPHDCLDAYGKTKSLGEPESACVIRTSIIGEKTGDSNSLLEWAKSQKGKRVKGFTTHKWNGVTCLQLAKIIETMISDPYRIWKGVRHVYSPDWANKYDLMANFNEIYDLDLTIDHSCPEPCDRRLASEPFDHPQFVIPRIRDQIQEQKDYVI